MPSSIYHSAVDCLFEVIDEDEDLLAVNKPAGLVCHPTKGDVYSSLISRARLYLGPNSKPQLINRLDRETSGVVLLAKHAASAGVLRRIWEQRCVRKVYLAVVTGHLPVDQGLVDQPLGKDDASPVAIKDCVRPDGRPARTSYRVLSRFFRAINSGDQNSQLPFSLLSVEPESGRKHQIRIHLAHLGHPIVGDKIYGCDETIYLAFVEGRLTPMQQELLLTPHQALHASRVEFPWKGGSRSFSAKPEAWFAAFCGPLHSVEEHGPS